MQIKEDIEDLTAVAVAYFVAVTILLVANSVTQNPFVLVPMLFACSYGMVFYLIKRKSYDKRRKESASNP